MHISFKLHQTVWHAIIIRSCQMVKYSVFWYSWSRQIYGQPLEASTTLKNNICFHGVLLRQIDHPNQQVSGSKDILSRLTRQQGRLGTQPMLELWKEIQNRDKISHLFLNFWILIRYQNVGLFKPNCRVLSNFFFFFEFQNFDGPLAPLNGQFIEKVNHYTRTKQMNLSMGPIVIFFLAVLD